MNNSEKPTMKSRRISGANAANRLLTIIFGDHVVNPPPQPPKRIVSKAEFVRVHVKRAQAAVPANFAILLGFGCACVAFIVAIVFLIMLDLYASSHQGSLLALGGLLLCLLMSLTFGITAFKLLKWGLTTYYKIKDDHPDIVPLTRFNAADLTPSASLVRASQEPTQAQNSILLRAVMHTDDEHRAQLLRAVKGDQE